MNETFDLESLVHVEQNFYDSGYKDGFDHGRIHGLIEGKALGREKGFEMWEEIGFYEGFALTWKAILFQQAKEDHRASQHIRHLLEAIAQFPRVNPSASGASSELDIPKLLRQIRSRYKALCSTLGVQPRLGLAETSGLSQEMEVDAAPVTQTSSAIPVWKLDNSGNKKPVTNQDLSY